LRGNWEMREGAQVASSTVITNLANPTVGDLTISGAGTFSGSRVLQVGGM